MISYGRQSIVEDDVQTVTDVLRHQNLTQGTQVPAFERALCEYTGAKYAVAVNSGTSGLHIACLAAGVKSGDIVYTTPNTFVASANCALYCGADVDFVDIDPDTRHISPLALKEKLLKAEKSGQLPKVVIVVHFAGHSCDMDTIERLSHRFGFITIEDNAHGLGGQYLSRYNLGNPKQSSMTVCSFHPVKSITTCEGGAVLTNDNTLASRLRMLASHGITKDRDEFLCPSPGVAHFEQQMLGFNYRLSDVHAALGVSQIKRIDSFIERRRFLAKRYENALHDLPLVLPESDIHSAWHLYVVELLEHDKQTVFKELISRGIGVNVHYIPVYWHPYFQSLGFRKGQFPYCENYFKRALTIPLFPMLREDQQDKVISALHEVLI